MTFSWLLALLMVVFLILYLVYALFFPEKF
jgi:K+-transporting ATPase KdpF subunit